MYFLGGFSGLILLAGAYFIAPAFFSIEYRADGTIANVSGAGNAGDATRLDQLSAAKNKKVTHLPIPEPLKAIYMTQCVVGTKGFREELVAIADATEINSIVIDIKDFSGKISFRPENTAGPFYGDLLKAYETADCRAGDMKEFIADLHGRGIYVIGRITVFQDPFMTKHYPERAVKSRSTGGVWKDYKGLSFVDVGAKEHWNYIAELGKESYAIGFDELNFDYIRYPSDGNMKDTLFTIEGTDKSRSAMLKSFFAYLEESLRPTGAVLSADIFGMTTTARDDLGIGQILEDALTHFDYVAPMVYPSHYPRGFNGFANPNEHVYEVINFAMKSAVERLKIFYNLTPPVSEVVISTVADSSSVVVQEQKPEWQASSSETVAKYVQKLRPWLQDFDYGGNYDVAEVRAQIQATYDAGLTSWMLWSPSNRYTKAALEAE